MYIIDRFEGGFAVIEDGDKHFDIPCAALPEGAKEGDVLVQDEAGYRVDHLKTTERRAELSALRERLRGRKATQ